MCAMHDTSDVVWCWYTKSSNIAPLAMEHLCENKAFFTTCFVYNPWPTWFLDFSQSLSLTTLTALKFDYCSCHGNLPKKNLGTKEVSKFRPCVSPCVFFSRNKKTPSFSTLKTPASKKHRISGFANPLAFGISRIRWANPGRQLGWLASWLTFLKQRHFKPVRKSMEDGLMIKHGMFLICLDGRSMLKQELFCWRMWFRSLFWTETTSRVLFYLSVFNCNSHQNEFPKEFQKK